MTDHCVDAEVLKARTVPSHVPPELVVDLDFYDLPDSAVDPQAAWLAFSKSAPGPLVYSPYHGGHWIATRGPDIPKFQRDTRNLSNSTVTLPAREGPRLVPLEADPPRHSTYRRNIMPLFTGQALKDLEGPVRAFAARSVENIAKKGSCNFIQEFALIFPVTVVLQILGLPPEDGLELNRMADTFARSPDAEEKMAAYTEMTDYLEHWIARRTKEPGDDAISRLIASEIDGRPYTYDEVLSTLSLLVLGGVDSVAMHLSFIALHLARNPAQRALVSARLDDLDGIISEFNRRFSIANMMRRLVTDVEYEGVLMKAGDMLAIPAPLHNLDESIFVYALEIDFDRPSKPHMTFGTGAHACPGSALARLEVAIFLQEWLPRIPDFELDPARPLRLRASATSAVDELWLTWPDKTR